MPMNQENRKHTYIAIDLKSFYASQECAYRNLDPLTTNLVVADVSRTEKTICLAVSPSLKSYGIPGRARLFEVIEAVKKINAARRAAIGGRPFSGKSCDNEELKKHPGLALDFIAATPRMAAYESTSAKIYGIYLRYVAPEDIHVYSIDEVFMDVTAYLKTYGLGAHELARRMIGDVLAATGITATAGIAPNLYLCKVAMDVVAKHVPADADGVRIAELDEMSYRRTLWNHRPLTDFWRVGMGIAKKLESMGIMTMGDIARISLVDEDLLFQKFGVNAEYLIDHAWGREPVGMADIKAYRPKENSLGSGQVLMGPTPNATARILLREMLDSLALELVSRHLVTDQIVLQIGYDRTNLEDPAIRAKYHGPVAADWYGRHVPKPAHGSVNLGGHTSSTRRITEAALLLYDEITDDCLTVRRLTVTAAHVVDESEASDGEAYEQLSLFTDHAAEEKRRGEQRIAEEREHKAQEAVLALKKRFGRNAVLRGTDLQEEANMRERNSQIGGHKA